MSEETKRSPGRPKGAKDTKPRKPRTKKTEQTEESVSVGAKKEEVTPAPDPFEGISPPPPPDELPALLDLDGDDDIDDDSEDVQRLTEPEAELYAGLAVAVTSGAFVFLGKLLVRDRPDLADEAAEIAKLNPDEQAKLIPIFTERLKDLEVTGEAALAGSLLSIAAIKATAIWGLKAAPAISTTAQWKDE